MGGLDIESRLPGGPTALPVPRAVLEPRGFLFSIHSIQRSVQIPVGSTCWLQVQFRTGDDMDATSDALQAALRQCEENSAELSGRAQAGLSAVT